MTNAQKYIKEGVDKYQFAKEIQDCFGKEIPLVDETILDWLADDSKPQLTEDERVILRNIKIHDCSKVYSLKITRACDNDLWLKVEGKSNKIKRLGIFIDINRSISIDQYSHLFKFIKERRRILY